jgi:Uma2 family endonuclease
MAVQDRTKLTVDEFERLASLPENAERHLEYVGGRVVEVVSNNLSSALGAFMAMHIGLHVENNDLGFVTGADGGYMVAGERYMPDVGFVAKTRQSALLRDAWNPNAPDLAVEVLSPSNDAAEMRTKLVNYLRAGTTVWIVDADEKRVEVYAPGQPPKTLGLDDTLDGGDVLPGFKLAVSKIFKQVK